MIYIVIGLAAIQLLMLIVVAFLVVVGFAATGQRIDLVLKMAQPLAPIKKTTATEEPWE